MIIFLFGVFTPGPKRAPGRAVVACIGVQLQDHLMYLPRLRRPLGKKQDEYPSCGHRLECLNMNYSLSNSLRTSYPYVAKATIQTHKVILPAHPRFKKIAY